MSLEFHLLEPVSLLRDEADPRSRLDALWARASFQDDESAAAWRMMAFPPEDEGLVFKAQRSPRGKGLLSRIDWYKNRLLDVDAVVDQKKARASEPLVRVWRDYDEALRAADAVDFNDLIGMTVRLLEEHPAVRDKWQQRFRYVLVDEYQDTNAAQYAIARLLSQEHQNVCATGDPDQSIYGWRGANIENILTFERDYSGA